MGNSQQTAGGASVNKSRYESTEHLDMGALSSAGLAALARHFEDRIGRGKAGDEDYDQYVLCQLERKRRAAL